MNKNYWTLIAPVIFLTIVYYLSMAIDNYFNLPKIPFNLNLIAYPLITIGIIIIFSVFYLFINFGNGTPIPKQFTSRFATKKLVTNGIFKYSRNPFAIGMLMTLIGLGFYIKSYFLIFLIIIMFIFGHFFIIYIEEPDMEQRFGLEYLKYKKRVSRWINYKGLITDFLHR